MIPKQHGMLFGRFTAFEWVTGGKRPYAVEVTLSATYEEIMHTSTLRAAGGSIAVTIPQKLMQSTGLRAGDKVSFEFDAGRLIISPVSRRKYTLQELLAMQGDEPLLIDKAWDNMPAVGQELPV